jgi:hypothetical protein
MDINMLSCANTVELKTPFTATARVEPIAKVLIMANTKYLYIIACYKYISSDK